MAMGIPPPPCAAATARRAAVATDCDCASMLETAASLIAP